MKVELLTCALGAQVGVIRLEAVFMATKPIAARVAAQVTGGVAENCGQWIPEERPDFVASEVLRHFAKDD